MVVMRIGPAARQFRNHSPRRWRQGARERMQSLYNVYVREVRGAVRDTLRTSRIIATDEHEDIVQVTFVRLFDAWMKDSFDETSDITGYVRTIARNVARDWLRHRRYEDGPDALADLDQPQDLAKEASADIEMLIGALAALPADLIAVYQGRFVEGLSQNRLADRLGLSRQRIRTLERRLCRQVLEGIEARSEVPSPRRR